MNRAVWIIIYAFLRTHQQPLTACRLPLAPEILATHDRTEVCQQRSLFVVIVCS